MASTGLAAPSAVLKTCRKSRVVGSSSSGGRRQPRVQAAAADASKEARSASTRVQLGSSDLQVSRCCLGTMTWGMQNTEAEAREQLSCALDEYNVNFIDTAEIYPIPPAAETQGATERYIGSWLAGRPRDSVVLATKVSGYGQKAWMREGGELQRVNASNIEQALNKSLQRLGTDHVDLLQIHWPDRYVPLFGAPAYDQAQEREGDVLFEEQLRGLEKVIKAGKVRYVGVSNETSYGVMKFIQAAEQLGLPRMVSIQNSYSLVVRGGFETDLAEMCAVRQANLGLLAYSPLAGGALTGKYIAGGAGVEKARLNLFQGYMARYNKSLAKEAVGEYCAVAAKHGLTPVQLALAWCDSRWFVASTIIGATSLPQLRENIEAFSTQLSEECLADIDAVYRRYRDPAFN